MGENSIKSSLRFEVGVAPIAERLAGSVDFSQLHDMWDDERHCYKLGEGPAEGEIFLDEVNYHFEISEIDLTGEEGGKRILTEIIADTSAEPDIVVPVFGGFGETSAQFEGNFLECQLRALMLKGYKNPKILGVNCSGRGSAEYMGNQENIARYDLNYEFEDARLWAGYLDENAYLGSDAEVLPMAHSMGCMDVIEFMDALHSREDVAKVSSETRGRIKDVLHFMPAVDVPFACLRPKFVSAVIVEAPSALAQAISGKGGLAYSPKRYAKAMLDPKSPDQQLCDRGVADSARKFLEFTLTFKRRFSDKLASGGVNDGVRFHILQAGQDHIIPDGTADKWHDYLSGDGIGVEPQDVFVASRLNHSIPFSTMTSVQRQQMMKFLEISLPVKKEEVASSVIFRKTIRQ